MTSKGICVALFLILASDVRGQVIEQSSLSGSLDSSTFEPEGYYAFENDPGSTTEDGLSSSNNVTVRPVLTGTSNRFEFNLSFTLNTSPTGSMGSSNSTDIQASSPNITPSQNCNFVITESITESGDAQLYTTFSLFDLTDLSDGMEDAHSTYIKSSLNSTYTPAPQSGSLIAGNQYYFSQMVQLSDSASGPLTDLSTATGTFDITFTLPEPSTLAALSLLWLMSRRVRKVVGKSSVFLTG